MELLSNDILIECILSLCDPRTIVRFSQTCKRFNALCKSNRVWDPLLPQHMRGLRTAPFQELRKRLLLIDERLRTGFPNDAWFDILFRYSEYKVDAGLLFPGCKEWKVLSLDIIEMTFDNGELLLLERDNTDDYYHHRFKVNGLLLIETPEEFMQFAKRIFSVRATPEWICRRENNLFMWAFKHKKV